VKIFLAIQGILYMIVISSDIGDFLTADGSNGIKLFSFSPIKCCLECSYLWEYTFYMHTGSHGSVIEESEVTNTIIV
jgi:hypothetical protein